MCACRAFWKDFRTWQKTLYVNERLCAWNLRETLCVLSINRFRKCSKYWWKLSLNAGRYYLWREYNKCYQSALWSGMKLGWPLQHTKAKVWMYAYCHYCAYFWRGMRSIVNILLEQTFQQNLKGCTLWICRDTDMLWRTSDSILQ